MFFPYNPKPVPKEMTDEIRQQAAALKSQLNTCDAVIIGAGAGLSTSAGFRYSGERFDRYFSDFINKHYCICIEIFNQYGFLIKLSGNFRC